MKKTTGWETQYLAALREIRETNKWKPTRQIDKRTGETLKTCGLPDMRITVQPDEGFPLLTVRPLGKALRMFVGELLWIISGDNTSERIHKYGVKYWDDWATPEMCKRSGVEEGTFGDTYGPQWRNYHGNHGTVMDQLQVLLYRLRNNPWDKRMRVIAWHPAEMNRWQKDGSLEQTLPVRPCHGDFYLQWDGEETISMTCLQMSADLPLGVPSNLAMYRVLLEILCRIIGKKPGVMSYNFCDAHIYSNQLEGVDIILEREPKPAPTVVISDALVEVVRIMIDEKDKDVLDRKDINPKGLTWFDWLMENVELKDYNPHPAISADLLPVAV